MVYDTKSFVYNTFPYYFDLKYKCELIKIIIKVQELMNSKLQIGPNEPKSHDLSHKKSHCTTYIQWPYLQPPSVVPLICAFVIETTQEIHIKTR